MKPRILFGTNKFYGMSDMVVANLVQLNFEVVDISYDLKDVKLKRIDHLRVFYRKTFLKDKKYKERLLITYKSTEIEMLLKSNQNKEFDYLLIINPSIYAEFLLRTAKKMSQKSISYLWDGFGRYQQLDTKIEIFDKFFVFDLNDYKSLKKKYDNVFFITNFYSGLDELYVEKRNVCFYLGSYVKSRIPKLNEVCEKLMEIADLEIDIKVNVRGKKLKPKYKTVQYINHSIAYVDSLKMVKEASVLLDFKLDCHSGLSFRFFEALKYQNKIITDNVAVKNYDFYDSKNIFIVGEDNWEQLSLFLESDYHPLNSEIVAKYSFASWLQVVLQ